VHIKQTEGCYGRGDTSFFTFGSGDPLTFFSWPRPVLLYEHRNG
ncbi:unnamed protein product, partial [Ectocarpus sp. 12 AP-2014]